MINSDHLGIKTVNVNPAHSNSWKLSAVISHCRKIMQNPVCCPWQWKGLGTVTAFGNQHVVCLEVWSLMLVGTSALESKGFANDLCACRELRNFCSTREAGAHAHDGFPERWACMCAASPLTADTEDPPIATGFCCLQVLFEKLSLLCRKLRMPLG